MSGDFAIKGHARLQIVLESWNDNLGVGCMGGMMEDMVEDAGGDDQLEDQTLQFEELEIADGDNLYRATPTRVSIKRGIVEAAKTEIERASLIVSRTSKFCPTTYVLSMVFPAAFAC